MWQALTTIGIIIHALTVITKYENIFLMYVCQALPTIGIIIYALTGITKYETSFSCMYVAGSIYHWYNYSWFTWHNKIWKHRSRVCVLQALPTIGIVEWCDR